MDFVLKVFLVCVFLLIDFNYFWKSWKKWIFVKENCLINDYWNREFIIFCFWLVNKKLIELLELREREWNLNIKIVVGVWLKRKYSVKLGVVLLLILYMLWIMVILNNNELFLGK